MEIRKAVKLAFSYPFGIERDYLRALLSLLDVLFDDIFEGLAIAGFKVNIKDLKVKTDTELLSDHELHHLDDFDLSFYTDSKEENLQKSLEASKEVFAYSLFERLRSKWAKATEVFEKKLKTVAYRTQDYNYKLWQKQVKQSMSVDIFKSEPWLETESLAFTKENVRLIRNVGNLAVDQIQTLVTDTVKAGNTAKSITGDIQKILNTTEKRASLIAVDQIGKFNGVLTKVRQTKFGVTEFIWTSMGDERVRLRHRELNGKRFFWNDPPAEGYPGQPIRCRCQAIPVFESIDYSLYE